MAPPVKKVIRMVSIVEGCPLQFQQNVVVHIKASVFVGDTTLATTS